MCGYKFQNYYCSKHYLNNDSPEDAVIKEKEKIGALLKDLVHSINTSCTQEFSEYIGHE